MTSSVRRFYFAVDGFNSVASHEDRRQLFFHSDLISHLQPLIPLGVAGGLEPIPADIGRRRGTPWTGRQSIAGLTHRDRQPFTLTFTPTGNLESTINLTCMSLDCGRKPEYPEKTHANTGRTCKLHTEGPQVRFEPATL